MTRSCGGKATVSHLMGFIGRGAGNNDGCEVCCIGNCERVAGDHVEKVSCYDSKS